MCITHLSHLEDLNQKIYKDCLLKIFKKAIQDGPLGSGKKYTNDNQQKPKIACLHKIKSFESLKHSSVLLFSIFLGKQKISCMLARKNIKEFTRIKLNSLQKAIAINHARSHGQVTLYLNAQTSDSCDLPRYGHCDLHENSRPSFTRYEKRKGKWQRQRCLCRIFTFGSMFWAWSPASASPLTLSNTLRHLNEGLAMLDSLIDTPKGPREDIWGCLQKQLVWLGKHLNRKVPTYWSWKVGHIKMKTLNKCDYATLTTRYVTQTGISVSQRGKFSCTRVPLWVELMMSSWWVSVVEGKKQLGPWEWCRDGLC